MPFLCYYILVIQIISGVITFVEILCQTFYQTHSQDEAPKWLLTILYRSPKNKSKIAALPVNEAKIIADEKSSGELSVQESLTWKHTIVTLDKIFFAFFLLLATVLAVGFLIIMVRMQE